MQPDSLGTELAALAATVIAAVVLGAVWGAARGRARFLIRPVAVAACLATAAASGLVWANMQVDAYPTWSSLVDSSTGADAPPADTVATSSTGGRIVTVPVTGRASGLTLPMYVYLPPGYGDDTTTRYPVIEALHGYPGSPLQWFGKLNGISIINQEIAAGRMAPTVLVFPYQTPTPSLDTECTNLVGGPQTETFLTVDVPAAVRARYRVRTDTAGWGLIGFSAGGYCATDLALRHPQEYAAGASLSGYASPGIHVGNGTENTLYNDLWRLKHLPVPAVALYLTCARIDVGPLRQTMALAHAARAPLSVTTSYINGGGHNAQTWQAMEAPAFDWLSNTLGRPITQANAAAPAPAVTTETAGQLTGNRTTTTAPPSGGPLRR
ncbi:alpha/beta hydrolase-fold protein [Paractinoplanes ferrugineus]|uniref:Esterase n=1 Tax=Paractinoplanes ferrugineus TaxID=113564 RepID=A0A919ML13_9ACTN|nr:alpha/beta hydrolase-fold protein [Actinoplanes ferrugineus]GIE16350.1 esterase [Actinoplanes ferrugineus]